ncbi:MAG: hypothetical protein KDA94_15215 [Acidimicrobiales bacterium]|nr:hypothetical protein [Acidimicrobiales bacterium]
MTDRSSRALAARRVHIVERDRLAGVVVDIDATDDPRALAVLQASLHDLPDGHRLGYGYDVEVTGLGAWVADRTVRISIWPAVQSPDGVIDADDPDDPESDLLVIDIDPRQHADALDALARLGRLIVAGPEGGPLPLVIDLDRDVVGAALDEVRTT